MRFSDLHLRLLALPACFALSTAADTPTAAPSAEAFPTRRHEGDVAPEPKTDANLKLVGLQVKKVKLPCGCEATCVVGKDCMGAGSDCTPDEEQKPSSLT